MSKNIEYPTAGSKDVGKAIGESIPLSAKPTKWTGYILVGIFTLVILIGVIQFPFSSIIGGDTSAGFKIGIPFTFLEFNFSDPSKNPVNPIYLLFDLLIYIFLAYLIDIGFNMVRKNTIMQSKEDKTQIPKTFEDKDKPKSIADKVTKKVFSDEKKV